MQHRKHWGAQETPEVATEWVRKALDLALELEGALRSNMAASGGEGAYRLRLARAHALGVVDVLAELAVQAKRAPRLASVTASGTFLVDRSGASDVERVLEKCGGT